MVPEDCAKCHTTTGYRNFLGADDSKADVVVHPVPVGEIIVCIARHNDISQERTSVVMLSGIEITDLGDESRCVDCHQGREPKPDIDALIQETVKSIKMRRFETTGLCPGRREF